MPAGTRIASRSSRSRRSSASFPQTPTLSRHDPDVQDWDTLPADERRVYARMMEVFAGFLTHTDHYIGELIAFLKKTRRIRQHADHADLRQRLERRRRPARLGQRVPVLQQRRRHGRGESRGDRRDRRPQALQPLPVGLDVRGQHAVPALEARDVPRRHERSVHRPLAEGYQGARRGAHAVRAHHRHGADRARRARHRTAGNDPRRHPVADRRRAASRTPSTTRRRPRACTYPVLRDARPPLALSRRLACRLPVAGTVVRGSRAARSATPITTTCSRELDATGWELYNLADDFAETNNLAAKETRTADRDDRHVVRRGRQVQRAADRQPRHAAHRRRAAADRRQPRRATCSIRARNRFRHRPRRRFSTGRTRSTPRSTSRRTGARACCSAWAETTAASRSTCRDGTLCFAHNYVAIDIFLREVDAQGPDRPSLPEHGVRADRKARSRSTAKARRAPSRCSSTAKKSGSGEFPVTTPIRLAQGGAMLVGADTGATVTPDTRRRSASPATSSASSST